jgi:hypothetical protein
MYPTLQPLIRFQAFQDAIPDDVYKMWDPNYNEETSDGDTASNDSPGPLS